MKFEWDEKKNIENQSKHSVSFDEAQLAFLDKHRLIKKDLTHSKEETRMFCFGKVDGRILTVRFTIREKTIRIIGAGYWRKGVKEYEEHS